MKIGREALLGLSTVVSKAYNRAVVALTIGESTTIFLTSACGHGRAAFLFPSSSGLS